MLKVTDTLGNGRELLTLEPSRHRVTEFYPIALNSVDSFSVTVSVLVKLTVSLLDRETVFVL